MRYSVCEATRIVVEVKRISHTTRRNLTHDAVILVYDDRNAALLSNTKGLTIAVLQEKKSIARPSSIAIDQRHFLETLEGVWGSFSK
jgi:hypothetical protein